MRRIKVAGSAVLAALAVAALTADTSFAKPFKECLPSGQQVLTKTKMAEIRSGPGSSTTLLVKYGPGVTLTIEGSGCPTLVVSKTGMDQYWYEVTDGTVTGWLPSNRFEP
jgi:hypothetical protein